MVLPSTLSMPGARTSRPKSCAAAALLTAALAPLASPAAISAALDVLLVSMRSACGSVDARNVVHCVQACGWLYSVVIPEAPCASHVRFLQSVRVMLSLCVVVTGVPSDETVFHCYEGLSTDAYIGISLLVVCEEVECRDY